MYNFQTSLGAWPDVFVPVYVNGWIGYLPQKSMTTYVEHQRTSLMKRKLLTISHGY